MIRRWLVWLLLLASPVWAATPTSLDISWTAPTTNADGTPLTDLAGYRLYLSTPCPSLQFATVSGTAVTVTGLIPSTTYTARVTAVDFSGNESACSAMASGTTLAATPPPPAGLPRLAFASEAPRSMPAAFVQSASAADTNAVTFGSAVTAGNLIVGVMSFPTSAGPVTSVTDTLGNTYSLLTEVSDAGNDQSLQGFYSANIAGGTPTITVNGPGAGGARSVIVHEVSGLATSTPLDVQAGAVRITPGAGADALTSGAVTTTTNGQYIFAAAVVTSAFADGTAEYTAGTGYTERVELQVGGQLGITTEDQVQTSAGSINGTFTADSGAAQTYVAIIATFKAAGGATAWGPLLGLQNNRLVAE